MKEIVKLIVEKFRASFFRRNIAAIYLVGPDEEKKSEVARRLRYFDSNVRIVSVNSISSKQFLNYDLIAFSDVSGKLLNDFDTLKKIKYRQTFNLDFEANYLDGWEYHRLLTEMNSGLTNEGIARGREYIKLLKNSLKSQFSKAYILGTGPSLEVAINQDWSDGVRIVSNTIVKDQELWDHIDPHFIVAGDAIYHFGISNFAENFRRDLNHRLNSSNAYFVFPANFYSFCLKEFPNFVDRLIPIPISRKPDSIHYDISENYYLPSVGNVLPLLLLPLASTLSKSIFLWGFDGRAPNDKLFWKNSGKHFYLDDVEQMMTLHPAFYSSLVPKDDPDSYVKKVHGDALEYVLSKAERDGFSFTMMHFSYTPVLAKRQVSTAG